MNHQTAPVEVREHFAIPEARLAEAVKALATYPGVEEGMIVSTCNRVEMVARTTGSAADLQGFLRELYGFDPELYRKYLYEHHAARGGAPRLPRGFQPGFHDCGRAADSGPSEGSLRHGARGGRG